MSGTSSVENAADLPISSVFPQASIVASAPTVPFSGIESSHDTQIVDNPRDLHADVSPNQSPLDNFQSASKSCETNASPQSIDCSTFKYGPYVPILRREDRIIIDSSGIVDYYSEPNATALSKRLACEVQPEDAIIETPSLVTPLLLKKKTIWPCQMNSEQTVNNGCATTASQASESSDDIEIVKVIDKSFTANHAHEKIRPDKTMNSKSKDITGSPNELIKRATIASLTHSKPSNTSNIISTNLDYFQSSVGLLLLGIGISRVEEFCLKETTKRASRKIKILQKKGVNAAHISENLKPIATQLASIEAHNRVFKSDKILRCPRCEFKSESSLVMSGHMEVPHKSKRDHLCNWCDFKTNETNRLLLHSFVEHKQRSRIEKPLALHRCRFCPYECRSKWKLQPHITRCESLFPHETFMGPKEYAIDGLPAITAKLIDQQDIRSYEQILRTLRLAAYNPHHIKVTGFPQPIQVVPRPYGLSSSGVPNFSTNTISDPPGIRNPAESALLNARTNWCATTSANAVQNISDQALNLFPAKNNRTPRLNTGIVQYPKTQSSLSSVRAVMRTATNFVMAPTNKTPDSGTSSERVLTRIEDRQTQQSTIGGDTITSTNNYTPSAKGSTFVICEICDGYIKDLSQLKSHMQWIHKVKIHQKVLVQRPPLNCQKCQWRFFTDQGLERHLLGAHGLVTSNMQDQVDRSNDSGRCTVCGRAFANKLVAHMKEVHKSNLKPAHLSYKCTVCSATFNLYRLFENHVYSVHSDSVRRVATN